MSATAEWRAIESHKDSQNALLEAQLWRARSEVHEARNEERTAQKAVIVQALGGVPKDVVHEELKAERVFWNHIVDVNAVGLTESHEEIKAMNAKH